MKNNVKNYAGINNFPLHLLISIFKLVKFSFPFVRKDFGLLYVLNKKIKVCYFSYFCC